MRLLRLTYLIALLALVSCASEHSGRMVAVTVPPQQWLVERLADGRFDVVCMIGENTNPETFAPTAGDMRQLERCEAYFMVGNLPAEQMMTQKAREIAPDIRLVDTVRGVTLIADTHGDGDADPHVWMSVRNMKVMAQNIAEALADIDPDDAEVYQSKCRAITEHLDSLDLNIASELAGVRRTSFAVWHPSLTYFAADYGLRQLAFDRGKALAVSEIASTIDEARRSGVKVLFNQTQSDGSHAEAVNDDLKATLVTINPMSREWEEEIIKIANALK